VCEGDLNAFVLWAMTSQTHVIGLPGAGRIPGGRDAPWLREAGRAARVLCWFDADQAGDQGASSIRAALAQANGWTDAEAGRRVLRVNPQRTGDLNDLFATGQLDGVLTELGIAP
jgi:hypothetical protein